MTRWQDEARCRDLLDAEVFPDESRNAGASGVLSKPIRRMKLGWCGRCPVRQECLAVGLEPLISFEVRPSSYLGVHDESEKQTTVIDPEWDRVLLRVEGELPVGIFGGMTRAERRRALAMTRGDRARAAELLSAEFEEQMKTLPGRVPGIPVAVGDGIEWREGVA